MRKLIPTAVALTLLLPAAAQAEPLTSFEHGGDTYVYQTETASDGATVITGRRKGGDRFRLVVDGTRVSGTVGRVPVSFTVAEPVAAGAGTAN